MVKSSSSISLLLVAIISMTLLLQLTSSCLAQNLTYEGKYDIPIEGAIISLNLGFNDETTWSLDKSLTIRYRIKLTPLRENFTYTILPVLKILVRANTHTECVGTYLLALLNSESVSEGVIEVPFPDLDLLIKTKRGFIDIIPKLIIVSKNSTQEFLLTAKRFYLSIPKHGGILVGRCESSLSTSRPLCACVFLSYNIKRLAESIPLRITIKNLGKEFNGVLTTLVNGAIIDSRMMNFNNQVEDLIIIPTTLILTQLNNTSKYADISVRILGVEGKELLSTHLKLRLSINLSEPKLSAEVSKQMIFCGDDATIKITVYNPNLVPIKLNRLILTLGNETFRNITLNEVLTPKSLTSKEITLRFNSSGKYVVRAILNYDALDRSYNAKSEEFTITVLNALTLNVDSNKVIQGSSLGIEIIAFKPLSNVFIMARNDNLTIKLAYVGNFKVPGTKSLNVSTRRLMPGNYSLIAVSSEGISSNEINISVLPSKAKAVKKAKEKEVLKHNVSIDVVVENESIGPQSNVSLRIKLSTSKNVGFKLYRYEKTYEPPWILQPLNVISKLNSNTYRIVFKAPPKTGTYRYRLSVISEGRVVANKEFIIQVTEITKGPGIGYVLTPEILYPLIATTALGSVILFRRYSRRR